VCVFGVVGLVYFVVLVTVVLWGCVSFGVVFWCWLMCVSCFYMSLFHFFGFVFCLYVACG